MNEDVFNLQIRRFLKKVGINSQREIERAVRDALAAGRLGGDETLTARMMLSLPEIGVELEIEDSIALE